MREPCEVTNGCCWPWPQVPPSRRTLWIGTALLILAAVIVVIAVCSGGGSGGGIGY